MITTERGGHVQAGVAIHWQCKLPYPLKQVKRVIGVLRELEAQQSEGVQGPAITKARDGENQLPSVAIAIAGYFRRQASQSGGPTANRAAKKESEGASRQRFSRVHFFQFPEPTTGLVFVFAGEVALDPLAMEIGGTPLDQLGGMRLLALQRLVLAVGPQDLAAAVGPLGQAQ